MTDRMDRIRTNSKIARPRYIGAGASCTGWTAPCCCAIRSEGAGRYRRPDARSPRPHVEGSGKHADAANHIFVAQLAYPLAFCFDFLVVLRPFRTLEGFGLAMKTPAANVVFPAFADRAQGNQSVQHHPRGMARDVVLPLACHFGGKLSRSHISYPRDLLAEAKSATFIPRGFKPTIQSDTIGVARKRKHCY